MNIRPGAASEAFEEIKHQFRLQIANQASTNFRVDNGRSSTAKIDSGNPQGLIHRHEEVSRAIDTFFISQCLVEGFAKRDADILNRVMLIHIEVTAACEFQIECTVTGKQIEHVIEKPNPGGHLVFPLTINVQSQSNVSLVRMP